jgi:hypothetical protein
LNAASIVIADVTSGVITAFQSIFIVLFFKVYKYFYYRENPPCFRD